MNKLVVKHSSIVINDYNIHDCPRLENRFRLYDRVTHTAYYKGIEYIKEERKLIIPRGVNIIEVEEMLNSKGKLDCNCDKFENIGMIKLRCLPRDDRQKKALRFMLGKLEYKDNEYKSQFSINLPTGFGKTFCAVATISYLAIKPIVITSSISWLKQWKQDILEYTNIKKDEIYMLSGRSTIDNILYNKKARNKYKILLASDTTIKYYGDEYGWNKISELFKVAGIGIKIYDEAHLHFDNMCKIDFYTNTYKTYYLTATPARSDEEEDQIYQLYFKNIPKINFFDKKIDAHTNYIALKYNSNPTPFQISECRTKYGLNRNSYSEYILTKENYYYILIIILNIVLQHEGKSLFFIGTNHSILKTKEWILNKFPELNNNIGVYTSIIKENKEAELDNKIILSTTKSSGTAKDIKNLKFIVVLAEPFKSKVLAKQSLGRGRNKNTYYIDCVDFGFRDINRWYYIKLPIFNKYASSKTISNFNNESLKNQSDKIINYINELRKTYMFTPIKKEPMFELITSTPLFSPVIRTKNKYILYK